MSTFLLPIAVVVVPVLAIVALALAGRRLAGSCGGADGGACRRCGRGADPHGRSCR